MRDKTQAATDQGRHVLSVFLNVYKYEYSKQQIKEKDNHERI